MLIAPRRVASDRCHQFSIGAIDVSIRSDVPRAIEDFSALYESCRCEQGIGGKVIHMEVRCGPKTILGRREYQILGDGEAIATARRPEEILPHLEWGINRRVIATRSEFVQLHAATLVSKGRGVVLAGPSGAGKSTLTAGLLARGWQYASDEFALIHARTGLLHAFPKAVCAKAGAFDLIEKLGLPVFRQRPFVESVKGKLAYVRPADIGDDVVAEPAPVRLVILPRFTGHPDIRLQEVPQARAAFRLASQMLNRDVYGARAVPVLSRVMKGAPCFALESGRLDAACEAVESLLRKTSLRQGSPCLCRERGACGCG